MNILFYTHGKVYPTRGGTERTTISVADALTDNYNCRCFSLYEVDEDAEKSPCFIQEFQWMAGRNRENDIQLLRSVIVDYDIDFIIDQGIFINVSILKEAAHGTSCKIILAHHFAPGAEAKYMSFKNLWNSYSERHTIRRKLSWLYGTILYPYTKRKYMKTLRQSYYSAYRHADKVVLLSRGFVSQYQKFGNFIGEQKFVIIPNGLSFIEYLPEEELTNKKPVVLIVSRMDETHKRISLALKIWNMVKEHPETKEWSLKLVGEGNDLTNYMKMVKRQHIPDVSFEGRQNPLPYYKEASLFMMSSSSMEAWGLTLTESQQMGVVPIAFNTYASLKDIITDGEDGVIIDEGDISTYVAAMLVLMKNRDKRLLMARNAIVNCRRFSQEKIGEKWWNLLTEIER